MRGLLALVLLLCLVLPARAADPEEEKAMAELALSLALYSLRHGDYLAVDHLLTLVPDPSSMPGGELLVGPLAPGPCVAALGRGDYDQAYQLGLKLADAANAAGRPDRELTGCLVALSAARSGGRPGALRALLPRARALCTGPNMGRYGSFVVETMQAELDFRDHPPTDEELLARHGKAFAELKAVVIDDAFMQDSLVEARLTGDACVYWQKVLLRSGNPDLIRACGEDIQVMLQAAPPLPDQKLPPPEFLRRMNLQGYIATYEAAINFAPNCRQLGPMYYPILRKTLDEIAPTVRSMHANAVTQQAGLPPGFLEHPVFSKFSFVHGDISRMAAQLELELARQTLAEIAAEEQPATQDQLRDLADRLAAADTLLAQTEDRSLSLSLDFQRLESALSLRTPEWEKDADDILARLVPGLEKLSYRPGLIRAYGFLGRLRAAQNRPAEAVTALEKAVALLEQYIVEVGGSAEAARGIRQESRDLYELLARLQLESGRTEQAADTLDRFQQLSSASSFGLDDLRPESQETREMVVRATDAQARIAAQEEQLATSQTAYKSAPATVQSLAETKQDFYGALAAISRKDKNYSRLSVRPNTFSKVQQSLPEDTVLVQLFPADDDLYLFVATRDALKVRKVAVKRADLDQRVATFRSLMTQFARNPVKLDWATQGPLVAVLQSLEEVFLKPIEADLAGKKVVAFVPTGSLTYFPFQALARCGGERPRFLLESMQVVTLVKASDLDQLDQEPGHPAGSLVALGDPDASLAAARREVLRLKEMFPDSQVWVGDQATRARLDSVRPGEVSYVHLATHGMLDAADPTRSYLLLAGNPDRISVTEIAGLPLQGVHVVTLSACQTALAERSPDVGADLTSLADAFSFAGSPTLIASLWKVEDSSTEQLMVEFYRQLKSGVPRGEALRQAQLELMASPDRGHPFFWAPFVLMGDWR
ncbi:MAG: CHAT domain-containing protein [Candidatus Eremiobacterota bacterium]